MRNLCKNKIMNFSPGFSLLFQLPTTSFKEFTKRLKNKCKNLKTKKKCMLFNVPFLKTQKLSKIVINKGVKKIWLTAIFSGISFSYK